MSERSSRQGVSVPDVLIALGVVAIVAALALPMLRARSFNATVDAATADVESLRSAAEGVYTRTGSWPTGGVRGQIPSEVRGLFPADTSFVRKDYTLQWLLLEATRIVEAPPSAVPALEDADAPPDSIASLATTFELLSHGRIVVHAANDGLLAALLTRYGREQSFVRDSTWTLVMRGG